MKDKVYAYICIGGIVGLIELAFWHGHGSVYWLLLPTVMLMASWFFGE